MNDPSSFQTAGEWATESNYRADETSSIAVVLPIRGKNDYGGLVRSDLNCYYAYDRAAESFSF